MLRQSRRLEGDIKVALTGDRSGICREVAAYRSVVPAATTSKSVAATTSTEAASGDSSDEESSRNLEDSDDEQVR